MSAPASEKYELTDVTDGVYARLDDKSYYDELTVSDLHDAIKAVYATPDGNTRSVGIEFIKYHLSAFTKLVPQDERAAFFGEHIENPCIVEILLSEQIFDTVDAKHTAQLTRDIMSRYPMPNCTWIRNTSPHYRGVSDEVIFECIMMQLDDQRFTVEQSRPFAESFLRHGAGGHVVESREFLTAYGDPYYVLLDNSPMWCKVPSDKFEDVIQRCLFRAPYVMFESGVADYPDLENRLLAVRPDANYRRGPYYDSNPELMLSEDAVRRLRYFASNHLRTLKGLSVDSLMRLRSVDHRHLFALGLPGHLELLVKLSLHWDDEDSIGLNLARQALFSEFFRSWTVDAEDALRTFTSLHYVIRWALGNNDLWRTAKLIERKLIELLASHGYYVGKIKRERAERHGVQAVLRTEIDGRKVKIVQNGRQRSFFDAGDLVYVDLNTDPQLKSRLDDGQTLAFANFHFVNPNKEKNNN